jgi:anti-sigma factor RsiW
MSIGSNTHVSAERLQALLDGALPIRDRARVEAHLAVCARCSEELEGWRVLFEDLSGLPRRAPSPEFRERVLAAVEVRSPAPLAERFRGSLLAALPAARPAHPTGERLQDFADGSLSRRKAGRVASHLVGCAACSGEVDAWRSVYARMGGLDAFAPRAGFGERVMAAVRVPALVSSAGPSEQRPRALAWLHPEDWRRGLAALGRLVPATRRAWAALAGIAVTPAVTIGLVLYAIFSHPTLTPQALASFVLWKVTEVAALARSGLGTMALDGAQLLGLDALVGALIDAPFMLASGALAYVALSALALRVLYRNLLSSRRHARLSHS